MHPSYLKLFSQFSTGLERVARVVERSSNYDLVLGEEALQRPAYADVLVAHSHGNRLLARQAFVRAAENAQVVRYAVPHDTRVLLDASTANNRRELDFFISVTGVQPGAPGCVVLQECTSEASTAPRELLSSDAVANPIERFFADRTKISRALLHQLLSYTVSYAALVESLAALRSMKGLIVANDHSPHQVALSMVCAARGIRRLYLQHAEVTSSFPPLDFEHSVLRNQRSRRTYLRIGAASGEVLVVPRHGPLARGELKRRRCAALAARPLPVGIYLSSLFEAERVRHLVTRIRATSFLRLEFIKPHPRSRIDDLATSLGVAQLREPYPLPHVAITGNSSVALDLAIEGNIVLQDVSLDALRPDCYRLVADRVVREFDELAFAEESFWADASLAEPSESLLECLDPGCPERDARELRRISVALGCWVDPAMQSEGYRASYARLFPDTADLPRTGHRPRDETGHDRELR